MTQEQSILAALQAGETITPMDALQRWGCFRLGARIHELKRAGWPITSDVVTNGRKKYAAYRMERLPVQLEIAA